ncbi:MAG: ABC transporter ATP-binding protein [Chlamydiales bacterium]|nr:ABC transporter ATP-binding protein [Chlamydiales bacterium]
MRSIRLENVTKIKNGVTILENISLTISSGTFFALLGPSGCGKTTLLRLIGGFETVDSGKIFIGNKEVTHLPINERSVNIVFQNYALFPHLTVFDNVAYGLVIKKQSKAFIKEKVERLLHAFHLEKHIHKYPSELSGGQQQRVALARAIINEPAVLLLDEPLAALDFQLREKMLIELIDLQDKLQTTFVYVTHDQFEALTVADKLAIMNPDGDIEQIGSPKDIYEFPLTSFVTKFVGTTNIFHGHLVDVETDPKISIPELGTFSILLPHHRSWMVEGKSAVLSIRPEKLYISKVPVENFSNGLKGLVRSIVYHGRSTQYNVELESGNKVQVFEQNEEHFPQENIDYDDPVYLYWQKENCVILER